jgi:hypothetical protein
MTPKVIKTLIRETEILKHESLFKYHALQREMENSFYPVYQSEIDKLKQVADHYQECIDELTELLTQ